MSGDVAGTHFFGPGVEADLIEAGRRCRLEISVDTAMHAGADGVHVEIFFQAQDERGMPTGAPAVLYASTWPLRRLDQQQTAVAEGWLPRALEPSLARRCYFRVKPVIMDGASR